MSSPAGDRLGVSVVVPTRDRPDKLERCLASVRAALRDGDELVVVDSASIDGGTVAAVAQGHGARVVRCELPGVNRARNAGWTAARHDLVLFTDDDVTVDTGWADAFAAAAARHRDVAFFTGWLGTREEQRGRMEVAVTEDEEPRTLDPTTRGVLGHSASLAVRRDVLAAVGGWDESLGAGSRFRASPEVDLFDRVFASGRVGRFEPTARAWHDQWRDFGGMVRLHLNYGIGAGARMAKLLRTDRRRLRVVAAENLWSWGIANLAEHVRGLRWRAAIVDLVRMAGFARGFVTALPVPVDAHRRFAPR